MVVILLAILVLKLRKCYSFILALGSVLACIFGGVEFEVLGREARFNIDIGVCYYLQVSTIPIDLDYIGFSVNIPNISFILNNEFQYFYLNVFYLSDHTHICEYTIYHRLLHQL